MHDGKYVWADRDGLDWTTRVEHPDIVGYEVSIGKFKQSNQAKDLKESGGGDDEMESTCRETGVCYIQAFCALIMVVFVLAFVIAFLYFIISQ